MAELLRAFFIHSYIFSGNSVTHKSYVINMSGTSYRMKKATVSMKERQK